MPYAFLWRYTYRGFDKNWYLSIDKKIPSAYEDTIKIKIKISKNLKYLIQKYGYSVDIEILLKTAKNLRYTKEEILRLKEGVELLYSD
jgi:hypothetical protein